MTAQPRHISRLAIRSAGKTAFLDVEDIGWIKAAENYVEIHSGAKTHLLHVALNKLEKSLDPDMFLRIHRSLIVNVRRIKELELQPAFHGEYVITLESGAQLQSGRMYSDRLKSLADNPF
jgi:two-component system LytT family response regulator